MLGDAIDNASKSAVSDSLKRSLRSLGGQFGNNLYSKTSSVSQNQQQSYQQPAQLQQTQQSYSQSPNNQQQVNQQVQNNTPQDYSSLYNIGLSIVEQGQNLVVVGEDIFSKKDSIKACGFRWDGDSKMWYKQIEQQQAA